MFVLSYLLVTNPSCMNGSWQQLSLAKSFIVGMA